MKKLLFVILLFFGCTGQIKNYHIPDCSLEKDYNTKYCESVNGIAEYRLPDNTICDCLTEEFAIEVDFAEKWYEAVGQSLHYALITGQKAKIVLIIENNFDYVYLDRLQAVIRENDLKISVETVTNN